LGWVAWASIAAATFAAALLQGASGFGFAVLALPLFLIFLAPARAVQLVILLATGVSVAILPALRQGIVPGLLLRLALGSLAGLPIGLLAFRYADPVWTRGVIGATTLLFAGLFAAARRRRAAALFRTSPAGDLAAGAVSGAATAMIGIGGPPLLLYLLFTGVSPTSLRATVFAFFLLSYAATVLSHAASVGIPAATWLGATLLFPFALAGGFLGKRLGDRLGHNAFVALALVLLATTSVYTLASAFVPGLR
jgi:uncharacterized protein